MKKILSVLLLIGFFSCGSSDDGNPILPNVPVNVTINLNLPLYGDLNFDSGSAFIANSGIKGIIVFRFSANDFRAWDAACPHLTPEACSTLTLVDNFFMECGCDESRFSVLDGSPLSGTPFAARQYKVTINGNILIITNF